MNEYNYSLDNKFRVTVKAKTENQALKKVILLYPEAVKYDLMAIINH